MDREEPLERELSRLEATTYHAAVADELARVREGLAACDGSAPFRLAELRIASPCKQRWADMSGDDRVRVCNGCERPVFDLSELTREQANAVLATRGITPCVRLRRRADGTVITADCPPSAHPASRRLAVMAGAVAAGAALFGASTASADPIDVTFEVAATTGGIEGVIQDPSTGEPVIGATILASSTSLVNPQTAITDETGTYRLADLPPGDYVLTIYYAELTKEVRDLRVEVGATTTANVAVDTGSAAGFDPGIGIEMGIPAYYPEYDVGHRPRIEWSSWVRLGFGTERDAPAGIARVIGPQPSERHSTWEAALGADVSIGVAKHGDLRVGAWTEVRTSSGPVIGGELLVQAVPRSLDLFAYDGEGILALRAGGNAHVATAAIAYGYLAPWKLFGPWSGATRYMIGARLVVSANRSLDDPNDWSATAGIELEPVGALRYLMGIRSWY